VRDLRQPGIQHGLHRRGRVVGLQLQPGTEPTVGVVRGALSELDAEAPATGEPDDQHRLVRPREFDGGDQAG
jgi:hypothetical protein